MIVNKVDKNTYSLQFEENEIKYGFIASGISSDLEFKKLFIEKMAESFDNAIGRNLGLTFPYVIGGKIFYSLNELNEYIKACQEIAK